MVFVFLAGTNCSIDQLEVWINELSEGSKLSDTLHFITPWGTNPIELKCILIVRSSIMFGFS